MSKIIGIDLGTTNSVVAIYEGTAAKVLTNPEGSRTTPSVVAYTSDEILVGEPAKRQQITNPGNTVASAKRFIGMKHADVKEESKRVSYEVKSGAGGGVAFVLDDRKVTPEEVGAKILQKLKKAAESYLGEEVKQAVITVPAYFDNAQRQATKDAGSIAGLEVLRVINEPTAAALAYGLDKKDERKVLVIDCGGGTTDISVLEIGDDVVEVVATHGDTHLGGDDFDNRLIDHLADEFQAATAVDLRKDAMALQRLKTEAERTKKELSSVAEVDINIPFITANAEGPLHLVTKVSRSKFESLIGDLVDRLFACADTALKESKVPIKDLDEVVFVGGSTRIPLIAQRTKEKFNKAPDHSVNPDEIVALGAAVQGGILAGDQGDLLLLDVTPLTLGIETLGGVMTPLIARNTTIPTTQSQTFSTASDNQTVVTVRIAQGERKMFEDNSVLGTFNLDGIPAAPRGLPQIEVEFNIDANGIVNVKATDKATGKDKGTVIKSGLSEDQISDMIKEAEEHADEDERRVEAIEKFNSLNNLIFNTRKTVKENEDKLGEVDLEDVETVLVEAEKVLEERNEDGVEDASAKVTEVAHKVAAALYAQANQNEDPTSEAETESEEAEDVVDVTDESVEETHD